MKFFTTLFLAVFLTATGFSQDADFVTDGDWATGANWSTGTVATNEATLKANPTIPVAGASINSLFTENSISATTGITISGPGTLTLNGTSSNILKHVANSTLHIDGAVIINSNKNFDSKYNANFPDNKIIFSANSSVDLVTDFKIRNYSANTLIFGATVTGSGKFNVTGNSVVGTGIIDLTSDADFSGFTGNITVTAGNELIVNTATPIIGSNKTLLLNSFNTDPGGVLTLNEPNVLVGNLQAKAVVGETAILNVNANQSNINTVKITDGDLQLNLNASVTELTFTNTTPFWSGTMNIDGFKNGTIKFTAGLNATQLGKITATGFGAMSIDASNYLTATALPVELLSFDAFKQENNVSITWSTASEENNDFFTVEKSIDGKNFEVIGTVQGAGFSLEVLEYSFIDESPVSGTNYYRLKQTDFDGQFEYFDIKTVNFESEVKVSVYPNPTTDRLTVNTAIQDDVTVQIFNLTGQLLYQNNQRVDNQLTIDLSEFTNGTYFLKVTNSNTQAVIYQDKLIKQ